MEYTTIRYNEKPAVKAEMDEGQRPALPSPERFWQQLLTGFFRAIFVENAAASVSPATTETSALYSATPSSYLSQKSNSPCPHVAWQGLLHVCFEQLLDLRLEQVAQAMDPLGDVLGIHSREVQPHMAVVVPMRIEGNARHICNLGADRLTQHHRRVNAFRDLHPHK